MDELDVVMVVGADGWGLLFGHDDDSVHLAGFESAFDAWAFTFAHFSVDLSLVKGHKTVGRWWTFRPKELTYKQGKLL